MAIKEQEVRLLQPGVHEFAGRYSYVFRKVGGGVVAVHKNSGNVFLEDEELKVNQNGDVKLVVEGDSTRVIVERTEDYEEPRDLRQSDESHWHLGLSQRDRSLALADVRKNEKVTGFVSKAIREPGESGVTVTTTPVRKKERVRRNLHTRRQPETVDKVQHEPAKKTTRTTKPRLVTEKKGAKETKRSASSGSQSVRRSRSGQKPTATRPTPSRSSSRKKN